MSNQCSKCQKPGGSIQPCVVLPVDSTLWQQPFRSYNDAFSELFPLLVEMKTP